MVAFEDVLLEVGLSQYQTLKGQFTQNDIIEIIYWLSGSSKPVNISLFCLTQNKLFSRMWDTKQFWGTID